MKEIEETKEEKAKIPSFIMNRTDVKYSTIFSFVSSVDALVKNPPKEFQLGPKTKVALLTNFGTIYGNILLPNEKPENDIVLELSKQFFNVRNIILQENELTENKIVVNNVGVIIVRNATLIPYSAPQCPCEYPILHIFTDQICGFTFGDYPIS